MADGPCNEDRCGGDVPRGSQLVTVNQFWPASKLSEDVLSVARLQWEICNLTLERATDDQTYIKYLSPLPAESFDNAKAWARCLLPYVAEQQRALMSVELRKLNDQKRWYRITGKASDGTHGSPFVTRSREENSWTATLKFEFMSPHCFSNKNPIKRFDVVVVATKEGMERLMECSSKTPATEVMRAPHGTLYALGVVANNPIPHVEYIGYERPGVDAPYAVRITAPKGGPMGIALSTARNEHKEWYIAPIGNLVCNERMWTALQTVGMLTEQAPQLLQDFLGVPLSSKVSAGWPASGSAGAGSHADPSVASVPGPLDSDRLGVLREAVDQFCASNDLDKAQEAAAVKEAAVMYAISERAAASAGVMKSVAYSDSGVATDDDSHLTGGESTSSPGSCSDSGSTCEDSASGSCLSKAIPDVRSQPAGAWFGPPLQGCCRHPAPAGSGGGIGEGCEQGKKILLVSSPPGKGKKRTTDALLSVLSGMCPKNQAVLVCAATTEGLGAVMNSFMASSLFASEEAAERLRSKGVWDMASPVQIGDCLLIAPDQNQLLKPNAYQALLALKSPERHALNNRAEVLYHTLAGQWGWYANLKVLRKFIEHVYGVPVLLYVPPNIHSLLCVLKEQCSILLEHLPSAAWVRQGATDMQDGLDAAQHGRAAMECLQWFIDQLCRHYPLRTRDLWAALEAAEGLPSFPFPPGVQEPQPPAAGGGSTKARDDARVLKALWCPDSGWFAVTAQLHAMLPQPADTTDPTVANGAGQDSLAAVVRNVGELAAVLAAELALLPFHLWIGRYYERHSNVETIAKQLTEGLFKRLEECCRGWLQQPQPQGREASDRCDWGPSGGSRQQGGAVTAGADARMQSLLECLYEVEQQVALQGVVTPNYLKWFCVYHTRVIFSTVSSVEKEDLRKSHVKIGVAVVDEAEQLPEPELAPVLWRAHQLRLLVLVGASVDGGGNQAAGTPSPASASAARVQSMAALVRGYGRSAYERLRVASRPRVAFVNTAMAPDKAATQNPDPLTGGQANQRADALASVATEPHQDGGGASVPRTAQGQGPAARPMELQASPGWQVDKTREVEGALTLLENEKKKYEKKKYEGHTSTRWCNDKATGTLKAYEKKVQDLEHGIASRGGYAPPQAPDRLKDVLRVEPIAGGYELLWGFYLPEKAGGATELKRIKVWNFHAKGITDGKGLDAAVNRASNEYASYTEEQLAAVRLPTRAPRNAAAGDLVASQKSRRQRKSAAGKVGRGEAAAAAGAAAAAVKKRKGKKDAGRPGKHEKKASSSKAG